MICISDCDQYLELAVRTNSDYLFSPVSLQAASLKTLVSLQIPALPSMLPSNHRLRHSAHTPHPEQNWMQTQWFQYLHPQYLTIATSSSFHLQEPPASGPEDGGAAEGAAVGPFSAFVPPPHEQQRS
mmetsp:Transcript_39729/g.67719  ORF Transcript_39729/g.67719 Transcript_39729/m.67719 type:complete len:127 (-) Transcript_39729:487-867(-)